MLDLKFYGVNASLVIISIILILLYLGYIKWKHPNLYDKYLNIISLLKLNLSLGFIWEYTKGVFIYGIYFLGTSGILIGMRLIVVNRGVIVTST